MEKQKHTLGKEYYRKKYAPAPDKGDDKKHYPKPGEEHKNQPNYSPDPDKEKGKEDYRGFREGTNLPYNTDYLRLIDSEKELGNLFLNASQGKISLEELRKKGKHLEDNLNEGFEFDLLLNDALNFLDELHDNFARQDVLKNPAPLQRYAKELLGEVDKSYFVKPHPKIQIKITYQKI